jgi:hypothetical protein
MSPEIGCGIFIASFIRERESFPPGSSAAAQTAGQDY